MWAMGFGTPQPTGLREPLEFFCCNAFANYRNIHVVFLRKNRPARLTYGEVLFLRIWFRIKKVGITKRPMTQEKRRSLRARIRSDTAVCCNSFNWWTYPHSSNFSFARTFGNDATAFYSMCPLLRLVYMNCLKEISGIGRLDVLVRHGYKFGPGIVYGSNRNKHKIALINGKIMKRPFENSGFRMISCRSFAWPYFTLCITVCLRFSQGDGKRKFSYALSGV